MGIKALIVEDNAYFQECLFEALQAHDPQMEITLASDGKGLMDTIAALLPQVVFMDVQLPGTNGIHLTREVRRVRRDLPIVVMTSYGEDEYSEAAYAAGATEFFRKDQLSEHRIRSILQRVAEPLS